MAGLWGRAKKGQPSGLVNAFVAVASLLLVLAWA